MQAVGDGAHSVDHWWSLARPKPWKRALVYAAEGKRLGAAAHERSIGLHELCPFAAWLDRALPSGERSTPCARMFAAARDEMRGQLARWRAAGWPRCSLAQCTRRTINSAPRLGVF